MEEKTRRKRLIVKREQKAGAENWCLGKNNKRRMAGEALKAVD
jgi:hypothetical protein